MKLTKKKTLEIAIELWEWIVDNPGSFKHEWPGWKKYGRMGSSCPFCEYDRAHRLKAKCNCPLENKDDGCLDTAYGRWRPFCGDGGHAAAVEFLAQLKELK